uniref:Uncharacterized protein n=1 Tax=Timema cristinae TaxID=61476 RepID=A0A7R9H466_TIMCR|nr:unnamed protein product [Timema cristinae]
MLVSLTSTSCGNTSSIIIIILQQKQQHPVRKQFPGSSLNYGEGNASQSTHRHCCQIGQGSEPAFAWRESGKPFRKNHPNAEIRASISPSSAVELNTTSALANYATEADLSSSSAMPGREYSAGHGNQPISLTRQRSGDFYKKFLGCILEDNFGKTPLSTPDRDLNLNIPFIRSLVYHERSTLDHAATEAVAIWLNLWESSTLPSFKVFRSRLIGVRLYLVQDYSKECASSAESTAAIIHQSTGRKDVASSTGVFPALKREAVSEEWRLINKPGRTSWSLRHNR